MKIFFASLVCLSFIVACQGQSSNKRQQQVQQQTTSTTPVEAKDLKLTWQVLEEKFEGKNQTLSVLTLENTGNKLLPATGWTIYFHSTPSFKPREAQAPLKTTSINGDLLKMEPTASFKGLQPGEKMQVEFTGAGQIINESRAPYGFYVVWDSNKDKGYTLKNVTLVKPAKNQVGWITPQDIYEQNQIIKNIPVEKLPKIFPTPAQYSETGNTFTLTPAVTIVADPDFTQEANLLASHLEQIFGKKPVVKASGTGKVIRLRKKAGLQNDAYELKVTPQEVVIEAFSPAGAFYGTQSLKTLIPPTALAKKQTQVPLTGVTVHDEPRFGHRAYMMDVARNFQEKAQVLKVLDLMAFYKLNVLHLHFSDDEGWRLQIKGLPELTEVGGRRGHDPAEQKHLMPAYASGPEVDKSSGSGYYTIGDFVEILKYADDRHIKVIPEIETPGHARAAIKAMDARYNRLMKEGKEAEAKQYLLRDLDDKSEYRSVQYFNDNVMDVSLPSTYNFLQKVTDEIIAMYKQADAPLETIHFGGDEVPAGVWEKSPSVQALIDKDPKVNNVDDLWYYYFGKVNDMLQQRGLYLSGWEEVGLTKVRNNGRLTYVPNPVLAKENVHVDVWNNLGGNIDLAYRLANAGYKVILTNVSHLYMDLAYQKVYEENGLYWGGFLDVDKPFQFIPYAYMKNMPGASENAYAGKEQLTAAGRANIVGLQAPLWSEKIQTPERLEYMLLPKLLGLAERAWAKDPIWATEPDAAKSEAAYNQDWSEFVNVLGKRELPRLSYYAGGFNYRIPTVGAKVENGKVVANVQLPGFTIRYTTDGSDPTSKSKIYSGPISEKGTIKFKVFDVAGRGGRVITVENK